MKMNLIDDLISAVKDNDAQAKDVRVGVSWTGVHGKYCGVAKTYGIPVKHGNYTSGMGDLSGKTTLELSEYSRSWNLVEASIGVAAINSMIKPRGKTDVNALEDLVETGKGKKIVMVGKFPLIEEISSTARELWVLEADPSLIDARHRVIPESAAEYVIPGSDIMIITGSTLINKSMERFLKLAKQAGAYTIILGPSTPMTEVLFEYGANMLAGVEILNPGRLLDKISQSGGMINTKVCKGDLILRVMEE